MKISTVIGARPQFIKAAVVSRSLRAYRSDIEETIVHTGQHYDANMSDIFFEELDIPKPSCHLGIGGGTHGENTGRMIEAIERHLLEARPDWMLVFGDTDSTLAGVIAASKLNIPISHVEAGLRSYNRRMPEEVNRILTDHVSQLLFTPTDVATENLRKEGISGPNVIQAGDVMYDAALFYRARARRPQLVTLEGEFVLSTIHRAENTDDPSRLAGIFGALSEVAKRRPVVIPLHPRTRALLLRSRIDTGDILIVDPVSYLEMAWLLGRCALVVTDSGGLQKEAYFVGKRCVTTRDETEWVELVEAGWNTLAGSSQKRIVCAISSALDASGTVRPGDLYGTGDAGREIAKSF